MNSTLCDYLPRSLPPRLSLLTGVSRALQEDEAALKLRQANAQDVPIDILTTSLPTLHSKTHEELLWPRDLHEGAEEATREFEAWIQDDGDADEDEAFCLAPELDEIPYQGEEANGN